jgi:hypothetical protein
MDNETLRDMYANLLAKAINIDTKHNVHPAYVEIIRQMSPNDAHLLNDLAVMGKEFAAADIYLCQGYLNPVANFPPAFAHVDSGDLLYTNFCIAPSADSSTATVVSSMDNLIRLGLIDTRGGYTNLNLYAEIEQSPFVQMLIAEYSETKPDFKIALVPKWGNLTYFGLNFAEICLR